MRGTVKAISRTTGKLLAAWPVKITRRNSRYCVEYPFICEEFIGGYNSMQDAADAITGGNDWVRIEVEWSQR